MISWLQFGIALLRVVNGIITWANKRELIDEGRRQVILEISVAIAEQVASKKKIQEHVDGLTDAEVDAELRGLEPKRLRNGPGSG